MTLTSLVNQFGAKNWHIIADMLNQKQNSQHKRNGKQLRERWLNNLNPTIK